MGNTGELDDRYRGTILLAGAGPQIQHITPRARQPRRSRLSTFYSVSRFNSRASHRVDISIVGPQGAIVVTSIEGINATTVRARFAPQSLEGNYTVKIGPNITDIGGSLMDQDVMVGWAKRSTTSSPVRFPSTPADCALYRPHPQVARTLLSQPST